MGTGTRLSSQGELDLSSTRGAPACDYLLLTTHHSPLTAHLHAEAHEDVRLTLCLHLGLDEVRHLVRLHRTHLDAAAWLGLG